MFDDFQSLVDVLLDSKLVKIDNTGISGNTPLMWAAFFGKYNIAAGAFIFLCLFDFYCEDMF